MLDNRHSRQGKSVPRTIIVHLMNHRSSPSSSSVFTPFNPLIFSQKMVKDGNTQIQKQRQKQRQSQKQDHRQRQKKKKEEKRKKQ